ncbi:MAG TPA: hypothetical protein VHF01_02610 [Candidatus Acidoferrum sp.]|nr:hypothetical protein [Candidatus Acidoferrum sp.]
MQKKTTIWYTLGEAEKATAIPGTRLDHACRVGRLPYRRSETGARLLSHDVVEKLRKDGLKSFPCPYDPIASSIKHEASSSGATSGAGLTPQRERVEQKRGELEEMRVNRDVRQLKDREQQEKAERRAAAAAERQAQAEERAQAQRQSRQLRLEEACQSEAREQAAREAEARHRRQQWEICWLDHALKLLPSDVPQGLELDVHQAVAELLPKLDVQQPERLTQRLIQAAIDKALQPWHRRKEIEKIIEQARNQLPVRVRSWSNTPNEWNSRAMCAAADAIAQLDDEAPLAKIRAAAVEAGNKVRAEYEAWKAGEDHCQACEQMVQWLFDGDDAREAVRQALEELPVGATRAKMENARDAALAPFRAAAKAAADTDRYLQHVSDYIEELGNEETGEWDLGDLFERYRLAEKLRAKLRPRLIQKLLEETLDVDEAHEFIGEWLDRELELED